MTLQLAMIPQEVLVPLAAVAAWMVLTCLRHVAAEIEHGIRRHNLHVEAKMLRMRQAERLRAISDYAE